MPTLNWLIQESNLNNIRLITGENHILQEIKKLVDIPLVLHGGSANPDEEISAAVKNGISKINISSDIKEAFYRKCRDVLNDPVIREPNAIYPPCIEAMKKVIYQKIDLFNDADKAKLYK